VITFVEELAGMLVGLQDVFPQVFLLNERKHEIHILISTIRDTHRVIASIIAMWTFVDLSLLHLMNSHVSLQMAR
jgi:hypothetical protein